MSAYTTQFLTHLQEVSSAVTQESGDVILSGQTLLNCFFSAILFGILSTLPLLVRFRHLPLECVNHRDEEIINPLHTYCLIEGKFTSANDTKVWDFHTFPRKVWEAGVNSHSYYIWVPYVMVVCGLLTHVGLFIYKYALWGNCLDNFIFLVKNAVENKAIVDKKEFKNFLNYVFNKEFLSVDSGFWVFSYLMLEFTNFLIPFVQFFILNLLMGGHFLTLGFQLYDGAQLGELFPISVKCLFEKFGPSGSLERFDLLCVLTLNIFNEKILLIAWFWLVLVMIPWQTFGFYNVICTFLSFKINWHKPWFCNNNVFFENMRYRSFQHTVLSKLSHCNSLYCYYIFKNLNFEIFDMLLQNLNNDLYECTGQEYQLLNECEDDDFDIIKLYVSIFNGTCSLVGLYHNEVLTPWQNVFLKFLKIKQSSSAESVREFATFEPSRYNIIGRETEIQDCTIEVNKKSKLYIYVYEGQNCDLTDMFSQNRIKNMYINFDISPPFLDRPALIIDIFSWSLSSESDSDEFYDCLSRRTAPSYDSADFMSLDRDPETESDTQSHIPMDDLTSIIHVTCNGVSVNRVIPVYIV